MESNFWFCFIIKYIHNNPETAATIEDNRTDHHTHSVVLFRYRTPIQAIGTAIKITLKSVRKRNGAGLSIACITLHVIMPIATNGYVKAQILKYFTHS